MQIFIIIIWILIFISIIMLRLKIMVLRRKSIHMNIGIHIKIINYKHLNINHININININIDNNANIHKWWLKTFVKGLKQSKKNQCIQMLSYGLCIQKCCSKQDTRVLTCIVWEWQCWFKICKRIMIVSLNITVKLYMIYDWGSILSKLTLWVE